MRTVRESFALVRKRINEDWNDPGPRSLLVLIYACCAPVCAFSSWEVLSNRSIPQLLATALPPSATVWSQMMLFALGGLTIGAIGACAGWYASGVLSDLAETNRAWAYRALFLAIVLPILSVGASQFIAPGESDTVDKVLSVITAPLVATMICYRLDRDGWPANSRKNPTCPD